MAHFEVHLDPPLSAPEAWRRVLDLRAHTAVIPLTRVTGDARVAADLGPGSRLVARTGIGPVGLDDAMVVESIMQPTPHSAGTARIRKVGNVVRGSIELRVTPTAAGCTVDWSQRIDVRGVPDRLGPLVSWVAGAAYGRALRALLARD